MFGLGLLRIDEYFAQLYCGRRSLGGSLPRVAGR